MKRLLILLLAAAGATSCEGQTNTTVVAGNTTEPDRRFAELPKPQSGEAVATFASGCYWCAEHVFESLKGVRTVVSGHAGGTVANPTYEQVGRGGTGHAEAVQVYYDPKLISYPTLLRVFFVQHDPTTLNRQGPDEGPEYRSVAFYRTPQEKQQIEAEIKRVNESGRYPTRIVTQVVPFKAFYPAERYHQDYFVKHPTDPYIRTVSTPRYQKFAKEFPELLKPGA
ncbi:peptide-methionine (S)-S-oxide reductase MsrA [Solirubrum puertoriconensis]|uniref:Peptide methionine sulfoxide reductase MsrA n=1 Tax=Solirubrum puertoriconensis TaxID=1751427 RepID=A0A9X0L5P7_SOLP1|nr:peptide-methionine (S)-S-oxide reductase MsrA [Solirubrum puertoriconensis]KUG08928.1 protein-methionine-S-oxide reductase [Solirubrum puertoriconensis]